MRSTREAGEPVRLLPPLLLSACFLAAEDGPKNREICQQMVECGGWGWDSVEDCEDELMEPGDYDRACQRERAYRACMKDCAKLPCGQFQTCEDSCWSSEC